MKIAIIGAGAMGAGLAARLSPAGHDVVISSRHPAEAAPVAARIGHGVRMSTVREASAQAELIVLATPFASLGEAFDAIGPLDGRIVVDVTNPCRTDSEGRVLRMLDRHTSSGVWIARHLPCARVVKAYSNVDASFFRPDAQRRDGLPLAVFYCGDDHAAKRVVGELICDSGFAPVDIGGLDRAIDLETGGVLYRRDLLPAPQARELLMSGQPLWPRAA